MFSETTGEILRIVRGDNDERMFFGASLQEKERLVKVTNRKLQELSEEEFKNSSVVEMITRLVLKNKLEESSISFEDYVKTLVSNDLKYQTG